MKRARCGLLLILAACGDGSPAPGVTPPPVVGPKYSIEKLKDPETCKPCHEKHYQEWSGSMHAYASDDPLFVAMNDKGLREANIGNFCVKCHAPMAALAANDAVVDTQALLALPKSQRGVTCYFCHTIAEVTDTHNNPLRLAEDGVMRGSIGDPVDNEAHNSAYSALLDRSSQHSTSACGSCHDIINDKGAHIERTFKEWGETVYALPVTGQQCAQCHMAQRRNELVADGPDVKGVFLRKVHSHDFPAVDLALTPFPEMEAQRRAVLAELNKPTLQTALCVAGLPADPRLVVIADNFAAGHSFPSGSSQDRQLWFELTAYAGGEKIYESGVVRPGTDAMDLADEDLWLLRDCMFDEQGEKTHDFWAAQTVSSNTLNGQYTFDRLDPRFYRTHVTRAYPAAGSTKQLGAYPERVVLRVWLQAFPYQLFDELLTEPARFGYTKAQVEEMRTKIAPLQVGTDLEWTPEAVADTAAGGQTFLNSSSTLPVVPVGLPVHCVTNTAMIANTQSVRAPVHRDPKCKP